MSINRQLSGGVIWVTLGSYIPKLLSIIKIIILARLLSPTEFGIVSISLTIVAGFNLFSELGLRPTLVQYRKEIKPALITGFWLITLISIALSVVCVILAKPLAYLVRSPQAVEPLRVIAWMMALDGLGVVPAALLDRRLNFKARAICDGITSAIGLLVAVVLALYGFDIWSLVWSQIATSTTLTLSLFLAAAWWPRGFPRKHVAIDLINYGRYIVGSGFLSFINNNVDYLSLARLRTEAELGVYTVAFRLSAISVQFVSVLNQVTFPAYARLQEQPDKLQIILHRTIRYTTMVAAPIAIYLVIFAPFCVPLVLGDQWEEAILPLQFLAVLSFFRSINRNIGSLLTATGSANLTMLLTLQGTLILIIGVPIGVRQWGASGAAFILGLNSVLAFARTVWYAKRAGKLSIQQLVIKSMLPPIFWAIISGITATTAIILDISDFLKLGLGTIIYGMVLMFLWSIFMSGDLELVRKEYLDPIRRLLTKRETLA